MPLLQQLPPELRKLLAFGHGIGIQIGDVNLDVAVARVRPNGIRVTGRAMVADYATRPAAQWGADYARFLAKLGASHLAATVLLPRRDVIFRHVPLTGVSGADMEGAIRFQLDSLHPYGDEDVAWGWSPVESGALVGIARRSAVDRYAALFLEAGIAVASFTFSAAAVHSAIRLNGAATAAGAGFMALVTGEPVVEIYGESTARPVYSAGFECTAERAARLAAAELRLEEDAALRTLGEVLPKPTVNPVENDLQANALPYATALASACPHLAPSANLLPLEYRRNTSRAMLVPTAILAAALVLCAIGIVVYARMADTAYQKQLDTEIAKLEPRARRAATLDREIDNVRARSRLLDDFRNRTRADLDALNDLTKRLEPPAWSNSIDLMRDSARVSGEAPQASSMLRIIDSSPLFENSEFSVISKTAGAEMFQIRTHRRGAK